MSFISSLFKKPEPKPEMPTSGTIVCIEIPYEELYPFIKRTLETYSLYFEEWQKTYDNAIIVPCPKEMDADFEERLMDALTILENGEVRFEVERIH